MTIRALHAADLAQWRPLWLAYLEDLFVAPAARGTGTARELMDAVFAEAGRRSASRTYWATQEFNGPARSLYDQVACRTSFIIYERQASVELEISRIG